MATDAVVAFTTLANVEQARRFVRELVDARVVACGTVVPGAVSVYRWEDDVKEDSEVLVILKTDRSRWTALDAAVRERHPYDVPELLALPVERGLDRYLAWITQAVAS